MIEELYTVFLVTTCTQVMVIFHFHNEAHIFTFGDHEKCIELPVRALNLNRLLSSVRTHEPTVFSQRYVASDFYVASCLFRYSREFGLPFMIFQTMPGQPCLDLGGLKDMYSLLNEEVS